MNPFDAAEEFLRLARLVVREGGAVEVPPSGFRVRAAAPCALCRATFAANDPVELVPAAPVKLKRLHHFDSYVSSYARVAGVDPMDFAAFLTGLGESYKRRGGLDPWIQRRLREIERRRSERELPLDAWQALGLSDQPPPPPDNR